MCFFDHSFAQIFFVFHLVAKPMLEFRENMMIFRTVLKSSNYNIISRGEKYFFAVLEVVTEFSAAWCLSIVSQGAKESTTSHRPKPGEPWVCQRSLTSFPLARSSLFRF